jgi:flavin reductase (DIM6/NTAB) family NADH-FMN oxidoreductase RutF
VILDPQALSPGALYQFMISIIVPRPIAFVSTVNREGSFNVAPFSYFTAITNQPPLLGISINRRAGEPKDTLRNIRDTGEFVVNVVDEALNARAVQASGDWPGDVSEFALTGLTAVPSDLVRAPRVGESPISLECRLYREIELGATFFVVGEVLRGHVSDAVLTQGRVDVAKLKPVGRLGGDGYSVVREVVHFPRPRVTSPGGPTGSAPAATP